MVRPPALAVAFVAVAAGPLRAWRDVRTRRVARPDRPGIARSAERATSTSSLDVLASVVTLHVGAVE
jgi:hypothetical protein